MWTKAEQGNAEANPMQYVAKEDFKTSIESDSSEYIILDVRKVEDFNTSHILGSVSGDVDAANKGGDDAERNRKFKSSS